MEKKVYLIGVGMGNAQTLTGQAKTAIDACAQLIGAKRLLEPYQEAKPCTTLVLAKDIAAYLETQTQFPVGVLLSGDVGFYSGATTLRPLLGDYDVETVAGMSSLVYFCAQLGTTWQDAKICSAHGRSHNVVGEIQRHSKVFALTGGTSKVVDICHALVQAGLGQVNVFVGENLSYPDQRIVQGQAKALATQTFEDLAVMLVENPTPVKSPYAAPSLRDDDFIRGKVPMTKEVVRMSAVCKLQMEPHHIVWDVGAGTGSVSVECARCVNAGAVYAIERKAEALALMAENKEKFAVSNLHIVEGLAPEALADLPAPDCVFLGGTAGNLEAILALIFAKNPTCRIVLTAVTLETLSQATQAFATFDLADVDICQIAVTNTRSAGRYHLFDAQNPVWMLSGQGQVEP
ncbi:precorrin-6y C5,15-methyltransferase (decarboxylating) subunit CbiE [Bengtsoniella intestinalis]|uniref:precorrin-6y C5,15-methyltransferase (decarboxylating) subunit CbiE n=1 Tax=Bengtsoniella intestinalis TaxID=3073143 RepID=UPI00391F8A7C